MKLRLLRLELPLEHEFTIARGSMTVQRSLVVELEYNGVSGFGESTENTYYGFSLDSMSASIERCRATIEGFRFEGTGSPDSPAELWRTLQPHLQNDSFALSAIDLAAHDLFGKLAGRHTFDMLGLEWKTIPDSSYTIGIDSIDRMVAKLRERSGWSLYKIKLGTDQDVEIIRELRKETRATFRVDANCGWTVDETIANSKALKNLGVEFIEQPLPADASSDAHRRVHDESSLPIIADENCLAESDVEKCSGFFHGVNVKLCKCGGLTPALRMLRQARSLGMKTMVGCMVESSVGISAAAQLLPLLDYADLDGAILLADDAAEGVTVNNGVVRLGQRFGNGVELPDSIRKTST
jgi:L-Ala-D/L-Glu epimerase